MDVEVGCRQCYESPDQVYSWRSKKEGIQETLSAAIAVDKNSSAAVAWIHSHERENEGPSSGCSLDSPRSQRPTSALTSSASKSMTSIPSVRFDCTTPIATS